MVGDVRRFAEVASVMAPAIDALAVTPSDTVDETQPFRALYIGTTGNVVIKTGLGNLATFANVGTATILPVQCRRVNLTNTTASGIVGLY
jgi:hypothetical protein